MPASNLAKVFGPTLVGYSVPEPDPATMLTETRQQQLVGCCPIVSFLKAIQEYIFHASIEPSFPLVTALGYTSHATGIELPDAFSLLQLSSCILLLKLGIYKTAQPIIR